MPTSRPSPRGLLQERIARLPWHTDLNPDERERRIAEDVDTYWPILVNEAVERRLDRAEAPLTARKQA